LKVHARVIVQHNSFCVYQVDSGKPLVKVEGEEGAQGSGEPGEAMEVNIRFPDQLKKR
jgi:hypothetical protein